VFLTNSSWLVLPVTKVEKKVVGDGKVGPITRRLRESLLGLIDKETQSDAAKEKA
jgi:branched-subunit amino acid aminotransferase/4-amino-4-deoxychorismate lyase